MPAPINDPALLEEIGSGTGEDGLAVIVRLPDPGAIPRGVRIVTRFADIATVRIPRSRLLELAESVTTIEAPRNLRPSFDEEADEEDDAGSESEQVQFGEPARYSRRPDGVQGTGRGTVVAALDWGLDVAHPAFSRPDGTSRILALWDQRGDDPPEPGNHWGYGRIHTRDDIDRALATGRPYQALEYDPADAAQRGGAHGTHVLDIAAGSGEGGGMPGVAPEADLVFVHLARTTEVLSPGNLGDSASVLEALDFVFSTAGDRPCVVNMSVGAHGGPHDGSTLVELGIDRAVGLAPGRAVVNSAGNYRIKRAHTTGRVAPDGERLVRFEVPASDPSESELELFYGHIDRFIVEVIGPAGTVLARVEPGANLPLLDGPRTVGRIHHVTRYGTSGDHHVDMILQPDPPAGVWALRLIGDQVHDGRYHAWIERDRGLQPKFIPGEVVLSSTTGTLCNGRLSITCGCANPHREPLSLAPFSSGGPTRDGRIKPELVAPGYRIRAARSTPRGEEPGARYTTKSGTSMAAPHVAGTIALMFEAAARPLEIQDTRALLFGSVDPSHFFNRPRLEPDLHRVGYGHLDISAAEQAARTFGGERKHEGEYALEEAVMVPTPESSRSDAESLEHVEVEQSDADFADTEYEVVEETAETRMEPGASEGEESAWSASDTGQSEWPGPEEPARPSPSPTQLITSAVAAHSWISDPAQLQRLALDALGLGEEEPFRPVSDERGALLMRVAPGDLLLRPAPISGGRYVGVVVSDRPESSHALAARGIPVETAEGGTFVEVLEIPPGGGPPRLVGRQLTTDRGAVPRYQQVLRAGEVNERESGDVAESIDIDDLAVEMHGLNCELLQQHTATRARGGTRTFASGAILPIEDWNGHAPDATIDSARVPKLILDPEPPAVSGMRAYTVNLAGQRAAVLAARQRVTDHLARRPASGSTTRWDAERVRLEDVAARKETIYGRMWIKQMMYNRFDVPIAFWTRHYNRALTPATDLDPNVVKSIVYQESRMGTSGQHLMPPPYDWNSSSQHPIRSRFNILQAVDSWGPQQWLMMKEMASSIWTRHGLDALEPRAVWLGMSNSDYASHPTFMTALKEFFQARSGGTNLMGSLNVDLHLDYAFWIRTGIRWLFEKYRRLRTPTWREAVRAYNGGGQSARRYRDRVLARVGGSGAFQAESVVGEEESNDLAETELSTAAELTWLDLNRVSGSAGATYLYYRVTGAPKSKAAAGDEGKAIFKLKVRNTNAKYNHQNVFIKWRLVNFDNNRVARVIKPWQKFKTQDLEDESSRIVKLSLNPATLQAAYDADQPLHRLEVEYHWREMFFTNGDPFYNRTGVDFYLMAPIELLMSQRTPVGKELFLDDRDKYGHEFWISLDGVEFTPELETDISFTLEVTAQLRQEATAEQTTGQKTTTTRATSTSTARTFSASLSGEVSQGSTLKATVGVFEGGVSQMFKLGGSLGYSKTTTDTTSTSVAKEFAQALRYSRTYGESLSKTLRKTLQLKRPQVQPPRGTGKKEVKPVRGYGRVGLYLYPSIAFYEVPYVKYTDVNALGQVTRRTEGKVIVPFIANWWVTSRKS